MKNVLFGLILIKKDFSLLFVINSKLILLFSQLN